MYDVNHRILSRNEVICLVPLAQAGCIESRDKLVESNIKLITKVANRYRKVVENCDVDDLIQEGTIGIMKAIEKFDVNKGTEFSTYAKFWIDKYIINHFNNTKKIKLPNWIYAEKLQVERGISIVSIDEELEGKNRHEIIATENNDIELIEKKEYLEYLIKVLTDIEKIVIHERIKGFTLKKIGERMGLSKERIRQIEISAYKKMKYKGLTMELGRIRP